MNRVRRSLALYRPFVLIVACASTLLIGCETIQPAIDRGAQANDAAVDASIFALCQGASIGSIRREFRDRPDVWLMLCGDSFLLE